MATLTKRATIYFDPAIHKALKIKSVEVSKSLSELIDEIVRRELREDAEDLNAFEERIFEPTVTYEAMVKKLKKDGKI